MAGDTGFALDPRLVRRRFSRAAAHYDDVGVLAREVARRMAERLDYIRLAPKRILDLGCGTGADFAALRERFTDAALIGTDFALPMLERAGASQPGMLRRLFSRQRTTPPALVCADATALPLAGGSISMVWSNLMLNWLTDPLPALREINRVLEVDGMLMFSTLGPDTLKELRAALPDTQGERVHRFIDMHDIGDALVAAGFSDPVMDMEVLTLTYAELDELLRDLRLSGSANAARSRPRGLAGRQGWTRARAALEALRSEGRLPATFEVVQGHAWKPAPKTTADGRTIVRFRPRERG